MRTWIYTFALLLPVCFIAPIAAAPPVVSGLVMPSTGAKITGSNVTINSHATKLLAAGMAQVRLPDIPLVDGVTDSFDLQRFHLLAPGARLQAMGAGGAVTELPRPDIVMYRGLSTSGSGRSLYLSIANQRDLTLIATGGPTAMPTIITHSATRGAPAALSTYAPAMNPAVCLAESLPDYQQAVAALAARPPDPAPATTMGVNTTAPYPHYQVEYIYDLGYELYRKLGSDAPATLEYAINLLGAVNAIYQRDLNVDLRALQIVVWTVDEPWQGSTLSDQLNSYKNYGRIQRIAVPRDASNLIDSEFAPGGIAYTDSVCTTATNYAISSIRADIAFPALPNSYYFDIDVVAHETGHNLGSPHTNCYSPPIDCCRPTEAGCCSSLNVVRGTIMSYCNTTTAGNDLVFHPRVIDRIRATLDAKPCVAASHLRVLDQSGNEITHNGIYDFGRHGTGTGQSEARITITNRGPVPLAFQAPVLTGSPQFNLLASPSGSVLQPQESVEIVVALNPVTLGQTSATLILATSDSESPVFNVILAASIDNRGIPVTTSVSGSYPIPDSSANGVQVPIVVTGLIRPIADVDFLFAGTDCTTLIPANMGLQHTWLGDVTAVLVHPDGVTSAVLFQNPGPVPKGADTDHLCQSLFDEDSGASTLQVIRTPDAGNARPPHSGVWSPLTPLSIFNGLPASGTWHLRVTDDFPINVGNVQSIALTIYPTTVGQSNINQWMLY